MSSDIEASSPSWGCVANKAFVVDGCYRLP
jgi:hypothetical protein